MGQRVQCDTLLAISALDAGKQVHDPRRSVRVAYSELEAALPFAPEDGAAAGYSAGEAANIFTSIACWGCHIISDMVHSKTVHIIYVPDGRAPVAKTSKRGCVAQDIILLPVSTSTYDRPNYICDCRVASNKDENKLQYSIHIITCILQT